jgi:predicted transcriptional regulator of viral defense system
VFSAPEAADLGVSLTMLSDRRACGRLVRLHQGVYSVVPPPLLRAEGHWLAAVLACGPDAVVSHTHAAAHWDLGHRPSGPVHVPVPLRSGRRKRPGITVHRSSTLLVSLTTLRRAIPVTTAARTLADIRRVVSPDDYERARSRALDQQLDIGALGTGRHRLEASSRIA